MALSAMEHENRYKSCSQYSPLDNPDEGSYLLEGEEVGHLKEKDRTRYRKGRIGFVFQSFNLIDELEGKL